MFHVPKYCVKNLFGVQLYIFFFAIQANNNFLVEDYTQSSSISSCIFLLIILPFLYYE